MKKNLKIKDLKLKIYSLILNLFSTFILFLFYFQAFFLKETGQVKHFDFTQ